MRTIYYSLTYTFIIIISTPIQVGVFFDLFEIDNRNKFLHVLRTEISFCMFCDQYNRLNGRRWQSLLTESIERILKK